MAASERYLLRWQKAGEVLAYRFVAGELRSLAFHGSEVCTLWRQDAEERAAYWEEWQQETGYLAGETALDILFLYPEELGDAEPAALREVALAQGIAARAGWDMKQLDACLKLLGLAVRERYPASDGALCITLAGGQKLCARRLGGGGFAGGIVAPSPAEGKPDLPPVTPAEMNELSALRRQERARRKSRKP